jgi:hypothetical protein
VFERYLMVRPVPDHDEWARLARDGGIFVVQGFTAYDQTRGEYLRDPLEVEGAIAVIAERKGWLLTDVNGPLVSGIEHLDVNSFGRGLEGGWWIVVPIDYLEDADDQRLEFRADYEGKEIVFWAFEAHAKRFGGPRLLEFDHKVEFALRGETLYMHDDYLDALRQQTGS